MYLSVIYKSILHYPIYVHQIKFEALEWCSAIFTCTRLLISTASKYGPVLLICFKFNLDKHIQDNSCRIDIIFQNM